MKRAKISDALRGVEKPYMKDYPPERFATNLGKRFSEEHKQKIGEAQRGRVFSDETRRRMSESAKRRARTPEGRAQLRANGHTTAERRRRG
jgi:hypothetical protein